MWPGGDKGYVGGTPDPTTSLENLGAREYNPANGRFLSADPIFEQTDPTQMGGYDYAGNNPVTGSDPTGLMSNSCVDGCHDKGDPFALPGGGTAESGVGVVTPNPPAGGGGHSGGGHAASSGPSQNKKDIIGGWLSENCAQSSPICNLNGNNQINPNSLAIQAAYDCIKTSSCQTANDLNALLDNRFNAALNHLGNVFNAVIFWVSLLGSLVGGVGSAAAKRVLTGLLGTGGPAGAAAAEDTVVAGEGALPADVAKTFAGETYSTVTTGAPTTLYRVYGGTAREFGAYWTRTLPGSSADAVKSLALDPAWGNTAENWVSIRVPAGTTFSEGAAEEQPFLTGSGGGSQIFFTSRVDSSWITGGGSLP